MSADGAGNLPLSGVKVLDLSRLLPGPFCSLMLGDMGAEVLKVEDLGMGDYTRWAPPYLGDEEQKNRGVGGAAFLALNRNKRSMRLNLKSDSGRDVLLRLVADHDVLLESFRPGVLDRLGVGYDRLAEVNPGLIYCAISGYGQTGPMRERAGHDMNYLGLTGLLAMTGLEDGPPIQAAGQIADIGGGAQMAAIGILAALIERGRSGKGQLVDISMTDGALGWMTMAVARFLAGDPPPRRGRVELSGGLICYMPYEAADGWVSLGALEPKFWQAWCAGVERPDLVEQQFERRGSDAWSAVAEIFRTRTRDQWTEFAERHDCCLEPVLELEEAIDSDLFAARAMLTEVDQPGIGPVRQVASPLRFSRTQRAEHAPAPGIGEHTEAVLREAGYGDDEIAALVAEGAVAGVPEVATGSFRL